MIRTILGSGGMAICVSINVESIFLSGGGLAPVFFGIGLFSMIDIRAVRYYMYVQFFEGSVIVYKEITSVECAVCTE